MKNLAKQLEKELKKEVKKMERSFTEDFNRWINRFTEKNNLNTNEIEVSQKNEKRFAEVLYIGKLIAFVTIENDRLRFYELI